MPGFGESVDLVTGATPTHYTAQLLRNVGATNQSLLSVTAKKDDTTPEGFGQMVGQAVASYVTKNVQKSLAVAEV